MPRTTAEIYLRAIIARCPDAPLLATVEWARLDRRSPCSSAAVARAALAHLLEGRPEAIARRLRQELDEEETRFRWRLRQGALDVARGFVAPDPHKIMLDTPERRLRWYEQNAERYRRAHPPRPWTAAELGREVAA